MPFLLDTCAILWLAGDPGRLSTKAREIVTDPSSELFVSAISAWEIAIKAQKGRLDLPSPPGPWWSLLLGSYPLREVPVSAAIALASVTEALPQNDPADRIIVSTARKMGAGSSRRTKSCSRRCRSRCGSPLFKARLPTAISVQKCQALRRLLAIRLDGRADAVELAIAQHVVEPSHRRPELVRAGRRRRERGAVA